MLLVPGLVLITLESLHHSQTHLLLQFKDLLQVFTNIIDCHLPPVNGYYPFLQKGRLRLKLNNLIKISANEWFRSLTVPRA